ncbi:MAG: hypothetical protein KGJ32_12135 [Xanthomonadaceae bacterium]|nr:hypothetical protein [Xanthomonadaceae bacterium]
MKVFVFALRSVFRSTGYRVVGVASFLVFFAVNMVALSTPVADEAFATGLLRYLDATVILRSALMAGLLGILTPFTIHLLRQRAKAHLAASSAGLLCSGVFCLLGPLCCGAISLILGWLAGLLPATAGYASHVYAFLGEHQSLFFYVSVALLGYALYTNSRQVTTMASRDA